MVGLFASNINWDGDLGKGYLFHNAEIQWAFSNREQVLEPLQKRGIKIILCILDGNGSQAGVAQLSELGVKDFAAEVARFVYANNVDGVFLDREYTGNPDTSYPYLSARSAYNCARLYHELKTLMPDKLMIAYEYSHTATSGLESAYYSAAEGRPHVSEYIDISCADYGGMGQQNGGLTRANGTGLSLELTPQINRGGNLTTAVGKRIKEEGWGYWFGFDPSPQYYFYGSADFSTYSVIARLKQGGLVELYGSELKDPTHFYSKMSTRRRPMSEIGNY
jgi:hypothetical protein